MPTRPDPDAMSGTPGILPRPDFHFSGSVGRTYLDSDPAQFPQPVQAPKSARKACRRGIHSQANDLARQNPGKLRELQDLWWVEAAKYSVLPLDWHAGIRMNAEAMGRPSLTRGRTQMVYYPGMTGLPDSCAPDTLNKSWTITAEVELP